MALMACPECGRQVSTEAKTCPGCGYPVAERTQPAASAAVAPAGDTPLLEIHPSWWNFGWHLAFCWLIVPLLVALYRRRSFAMRIYHSRVAIEEGWLSKEYREFFIKDIRSIEVRQGFWGGLVDVGDVQISTAAAADATEEAVGVRHPKQIKELLIARREQSGKS